MGTFTNMLKFFFGSKAEKDMKEVTPVLKKVLAEYEKIDILSDDQLREHSAALRQRIWDRTREDEERSAALKAQLEDPEIKASEKESIATEIDKLTKRIDETIETVLDEILPEAFAIMKSTARRFKENEEIRVKASEMDREFAASHDFVNIEGDTAVWKHTWMAGGNPTTWDMVHYDVQLIGGIVLHKGKIAEMATGEGKTLVATLPVFLNALAGKGVHVVTVNDYLSKRDSEWMGPMYMFHGLRVDCIDKHQPSTEARKKAYRADITFGTNNEFGFDYLRDNMAVSVEDLVQRKHHYAIVDEVDSVLIDDARTPLIISGPVTKGDDQQFDQYKPYIEKIYSAQRQLVIKYLSDARRLIAEGDETEGGKALLRAHKGLPKYQPLIKFLSEQGIKQLLQKTENFYMQDNNRQMHIITDELYFVIEEVTRSVEMTDKGNDFMAGMVGDDKFFVLPDIGSEIAELEKKQLDPENLAKEKDALLTDYALKSERVHTTTQLLKAYAMFERDVDYVLMDGKVKIVDEQTGRIMEGRRWSDGLHQAVEAKENVKVEAATQTFATITLQNYFRMYHKLAGMTGTAATEAGEYWQIYKLDVVVIPTNRPVLRDDQNDLIYKTKKEKYNAVINLVVELTAAGRPVLVGTTSVEISELLSRMLKIRGIKHNVLNAKNHAHEAEVVANAGLAGTVTIATNMAGRGTDIKLGPGVKEAGGLAIIGTERHDSRRVDRQLRGRAGRQGDPGSSIFFISLEDDLMRKFGSERIAGLVDRMGLEEGESLQHKMLSNSIEKAQRKVEENAFGVRKRLIEYDDVMNSQRDVIYNKRRNALYGDKIDIDVYNMVCDFSETLGEQSKGLGYEEFRTEVMTTLSVDPAFDAKWYRNARQSEIADALSNKLKEEFERHGEILRQQAWPILKQLYETQGAFRERLVFPIWDGIRQVNGQPAPMGVVFNLKKAYETSGKEFVRAVSKTITLAQIDHYWMEHLREMDELKQSVQNASYEQKDPLLIYKFESFELFQGVIEKVTRDVLSFLYRCYIPLRANDAEHAPSQVTERRRADMSQMRTSRTDLVTNSGEPKSNAPIRVEKKVGRNDPCPCGSGKKFKNCHGKDL